MDDYNQAEDLPLGLMMQLGTNMEAMQTFSAMSTAEKERMVNYIKGAGTGGDVRARIDEVMNALENHQSLF